MHSQSEPIEIEEIDEDNEIAHLYGSDYSQQSSQLSVLSMNNQVPAAIGLNKKHSSNGSGSNNNFRDEVYSQRAFKKKTTKEKSITKVVNKVEKALKQKREKTYILMLENKVQALEKEVTKLKSLNLANQEYIKKLSTSEHIINGIFVGRTQIYERMETMIERPETPENRKEMIKQISTLRYRLGVYGKDRIKATNYHFKELIQSFIPEVQKFLIYTACQNKDFFAPCYIQTGSIAQAEPWRQEMLRELNLSLEDRQYINSHREAIMKEKLKYDDLVLEFYKVKNELSKQAKNLENIFDTFRSFLNPRQLTKILVNMERNKYRKEMMLDSVESFWRYEFQKSESENYYTQNTLFSTGFDNWA